MLVDDDDELTSGVRGGNLNAPIELSDDEMEVDDEATDVDTGDDDDGPLAL